MNQAQNPSTVNTDLPSTLPATPVDADLAATEFMDIDNPELVAYASKITEGLDSDAEKAAALFLAVRDGLRYDPYSISDNPSDYKASGVLAGSQKWCVSKAVLLAALTRSVGIPTRLGFADVKNHLQTDKLAERMGNDLFTWHGFAVIWIDGEWRKASPAFNKELCQRFGTKVLEFDGHGDALLHGYDEAGNRHMEYVRDRGQYQDLPFGEIMATFAEIYPSMVDGETTHDAAFHD